MNHVESQILDLVARLFPEPFARLAEYRKDHHRFVDSTVARFEREVQFYLAYMEYIAPLKAAGLFDLAGGYFDRRMPTALFLRAGRGADGARSFRLSEGEPLPTSFGEDSYCKIFGTPIGTSTASPV